MSESLLKKWRELAYGQEMQGKKGERFWAEYFVLEKGIYEQLLSDPDNVVKGTVSELAQKYDLAVMYMVGFSNASYFTRCFVAEFGKTPMEYLGMKQE